MSATPAQVAAAKAVIAKEWAPIETRVPAIMGLKQQADGFYADNVDRWAQEIADAVVGAGS